MFNKKSISIFLILLVIEIIIAVFIHDNFIRLFVGDMLVVMLIFYFVRIFYRKNTLLVILGVLLFACGIEVLQYLYIIEILGIENRALQIMIGSTFDWKDIAMYGLGCIILYIVSRKKRIYIK